MKKGGRRAFFKKSGRSAGTSQQWGSGRKGGRGGRRWGGLKRRHAEKVVLKPRWGVRCTTSSTCPERRQANIANDCSAGRSPKKKMPATGLKGGGQTGTAAGEPIFPREGRQKGSRQRNETGRKETGKYRRGPDALKGGSSRWLSEGDRLGRTISTNAKCHSIRQGARAGG